jgi:transcriptional regulator with XRE-family HTH domain
MRDYDLEKNIASIIEQLKSERIAKNISHEKLAEKCGLDRSTISLIESGKRTPTILTYLKICKALDLKGSKIFIDNNL